MSGDEAMNERLRRMAVADVPAPDPRFVDHLDARLRVAHGERAGAGPRIRWAPALAATALVVVGLVGAIALRDRSPEAVVMTVASDTSVYLADGPVPGSPGLELPDGARIVVGPAGEAVVDGVVLTAGSEAVVTGDRVTVVVTGVDRQPTDPDRSTPSGPADDERADPPPLSVRPSTSTTTRGTAPPGDRPARSSTSTTSPDRPTTGPPADDGGSTTAVAQDPTRPAPTRPSSTTTASVDPTDPGTTATTAPADPITLTATAVGGDRVRLDWVVEPDLTPAGWRVKARGDDRVTTLLVIRDGDARSATLERARTAGLGLWVEAVDRSGRTLAVSEPVTVR